MRLGFSPKTLGNTEANMHAQGAELQIIRNRKGRKRKTGRRTANGRPVDRHRVDYRGTVAAQPHRNWLPVALRESERAESVLGCLNLLNRISEHEYEAGRRFAVIVGAYRSAIGTPRGTVGAGRGYSCEPEACAKYSHSNPDWPCSCEIRIAKFRDSARALILVSQKAYNLVYQVAVHDFLCTREQLDDLQAGLRGLARHYGLGGRP